MEQNNNLKKKAGISIGIVVVLIVVLATLLNESKTTVSNKTDTSSVPSIPAVPNTPIVNNTKNYSAIYKNGTYSAIGSYSSPGGEDQISVSVTLTNDIITNATVTSVKADRTSLRYQNKFIAGYKQYVIGKNISDINIDIVSGSSLTPEGFNNALNDIKSQAKA